MPDRLGNGNLSRILSQLVTLTQSSMRHLIPALLAILLLPAETLSRSSFDVVREIRGDGSRGPFSLGLDAIVEDSDSVWVGTRALVRHDDYTLSYKGGTIVLSEPIERGQNLMVVCQRRIRVLAPLKRRERPASISNQILSDIRRKPRRRPVAQSSDADPQGVRIQGVKRVGVAVGTTSESALTQSLRLELSGTLGDGVRVSGFLTDRSLPVNAQGQSRSIQDLDRVHLEVASSRFSAGLGDVDLRYDGTTFGRYRRQLQGARFRANTGGFDVDLFGAVSEGDWVTRRLLTLPGYQGPYALSTSSHPILPGSERVYLDGRQLRRGEGQDYAIEYDRGVVTFTATNPISGQSRVTVAFQEVAPEGQIRSVGLRGQMVTSDSRGRLGTTIIRESAGGNQAPGRAVLSPGALLSALDGSYAPAPGVRLSGEFALSRRHLPSENMGGHAAQAAVVLETPQARRGEDGVGSLQLSGSFRQVDRSFRSLDRLEHASTEGAWGWEAGIEDGYGRVGEASLLYSPTSFGTVGIQVGQRSGSVSAKKAGASVDAAHGNSQMSVRYDRIDRNGDGLTRLDGAVGGTIGWLRPSLRVRSETAVGQAVSGSRLFYATHPEALPEGARVRDIEWSADAGNKRWSLRSSLQVSRIEQLSTVWEDSVRSWTHSNTFQATLNSGFQMSGSFGQMAREENGSGLGARLVNLGRIQLAYRPASGILSQQVQYRVSSTGLPARDRAFVQVLDGEGSYVWEDVDGDGVQDQEEFVPDPGGDYIPFYGVATTFEAVRESSVGTRTILDLGRGRYRDTRILRDVAVELSLESERHNLPHLAGQLAPWTHHRFVDDTSVLSARRELRSTLHLMRRNRLGSIRVDARRTDEMDRRRSEDGRTEIQGWMFVGKLRPVRGVDVELRTETVDRSRAGDGAFAHEIAERGAEMRGFVRLADGWQTGVTMGWASDTERLRQLQARKLSFGPELRRAFRGRGRFRGRFDWTNVASDDVLPLFLGLADGQRPGQSYRWRFGLDYRLGAYVDAFVTYDGMVRPDRPALHVGRMELRAAF